MRQLPVVALALFLASGVVVAQDAPVAVEIRPANGAKDVAVDIGKIEVRFDRDMQTDSFSVVGSESGETPPVSGSVTFTNARTLVIPMDRLEPGTTYALFLNKGLRRNFRSTEGVPLEPFELVFTTAAAVAPTGPRVVRTVPENGATDVDPGLEAVEVWFSEDMNRASMSLVRLQDRQKLGYRADARPFFDGPRHLVIPVRLAPGIEYGVGLHGSKERGFRSAAGEPLEPIALRFATKEDGGKTTEGPIGRWRLARVADRAVDTGLESRFELHVFPDRSWGCLTVQEGKSVYVGGRWREMPGNRLELRSDKGVLSMADLLPPAVVRGHMMVDVKEAEVDPGFFWIAKSETEVERTKSALRLGPAENPIFFEPVPPVPAATLAGTWKSWPGNRVERTWKLGDGGAATGRIPGGPWTGKWSSTDLRIEVVAADGEETVRGYWLFVPPSKPGDLDMLLIFVDDSDELIVFGRAPGDAPPKGVVGTWTARDEQGVATITFKPDGTYDREFRTPEGVNGSRGTWRVEGSVLKIRDEEEGDIDVPFALLGDDVLRLTIEGQPIEFRRAGKEPPVGPLPKELGGKWAAEDESGLIILLLMGDGKFEFLLKHSGGKAHFAGTWTHSTGLVVLSDTKQGRTFRVPYRLADPRTLFVTLEGDELRLVKVSEDPTRK
jgi:hypothetical protein